jgi:hypothetical protein
MKKNEIHPGFQWNPKVFQRHFMVAVVFFLVFAIIDCRTSEEDDDDGHHVDLSSIDNRTTVDILHLLQRYKDC